MSDIDPMTALGITVLATLIVLVIMHQNSR
jgi:hypothetical protein